MQPYLITIQVCKSCSKINGGIDDIDSFLSTVRAKLQSQRSDFEWKLEPSSCMKVCPIGRITMTVSSSRNPEDVRLTFSKEANADSVVHQVLSFFRTL